MMKIEQGDRAQNSARERQVQIPVGRVMLRGDLAVPDSAGGIVLFAHGSGSSRHSPRNRYVAQVLQRAGLATLLMDLLTPDEDALDAQTAALRFDIALRARRLIGATFVGSTTDGTATDWVFRCERWSSSGSSCCRSSLTLWQPWSRVVAGRT
jgi:hypothetical protein